MTAPGGRQIGDQTCGGRRTDPHREPLSGIRIAPRSAFAACLRPPPASAARVRPPART